MKIRGLTWRVEGLWHTDLFDLNPEQTYRLEGLEYLHDFKQKHKVVFREIVAFEKIMKEAV